MEFTSRRYDFRDKDGDYAALAAELSGAADRRARPDCQRCEHRRAVYSMHCRTSTGRGFISCTEAEIYLWPAVRETARPTPS